MKILILLLSASLFLSATSYQEQESPELKEASELSDSVIKLVNEQKYDEALPLAKRAAQIREKLLPRTDPRVQASLQRLGDLYLVRREYDSARQTFERLLKILEEHYGPTAWNLGGTLDRLAVLHYRLGNMSKAEDMYQRAVEVREKASGPDDVAVAEPLFAMAQFQRLRKDYDHALLSYKRVLSIYAKNKDFSAASGFQRASNGFYCLAYQSNKPEVYKELEQARSPFSQALFWDELPRIINGKALSLPKPEYPQGARDYQLSGAVYVLVEIDETGKVINAVDMCGGPPFLSESSVAAALKSRFSPTKVSGKPVKVKGLIQYNFVRQ